ncbi:CheR family methyltransferase [Streptomyces sp. NPDC050504]|uniref:CheR family methyltransferase n=1 Tax=Streptomyces sp. NPDC050504 TaxID=3365618 RepID=UPI0037AE62CB
MSEPLEARGARNARDARDARDAQGARDAPGSGADEDLDDLLGFLRDARGFDPARRDRQLLGRRLRGRMVHAGTAAYADYRARLAADPAELSALVGALLAGPAVFFHDPGTWDLLRREVVPAVLEGPDCRDEVRVWSAGCAGGEEAYALAIVFAQALGVGESLRRVRIRGTDVDEGALLRARTGLYAAGALAPLDAGLRDEYFARDGARFRFRADLRHQVVFERHDLTRDAPPSGLDLLVCRDTLVYFDAGAQGRIMGRFHRALREGGLLFLGGAGRPLAGAERFEASDAHERFFRRPHEHSRGRSRERHGERHGETGTDAEADALRARIARVREDLERVYGELWTARSEEDKGELRTVIEQLEILDKELHFTGEELEETRRDVRLLEEGRSDGPG